MTPDAPLSPERVVGLLEDSRSYPHDPGSVDIVQTHISFVAIAPPLVFKVKKAVDLGFLDFSTLAKRRHYCEEEVRLNRRLCSSVYEGVVPILPDAGAPSGLRLGTVAEVEHPDAVEYAVRMKQLPDGYFMGQLLAAGALTDEHLERVAGKLTRFYREHPATEASSVWGTIERIRLSIDENFAQIGSHVGPLVSESAVAVLREDADCFLEDQKALFARRVETGMIRDCHGDLHLDHIHITPEDICIYDCIEFNERFRYIDIASDIAFLAMDLDFHGRPDVAAKLTRHMQRALDDPDLDRLVSFYKTYRAIVRAKVEGMKSQEEEVPETERAVAADQAKAHYRLATQYAVTGGRPMVVAMMGRVATGKSTQARLLGRALGWPVLSSDETRKRLAGVPLYERGDETNRADLYSEESSDRTYAALREAAQSQLAAGRSVVLDATFGRRSERDRLRKWVTEFVTPSGNAVSLRIVELTATDDLIRERLGRRESRTDVVSDARLSDFPEVSALHEPLEEDVGPGVMRVSSDIDPDDTGARILSQLARSHRRVSDGGTTSTT